ncbi:MAG: EamA-like transporter family protein [Gemmataceae bacterium]|nr:EamA-like transporter family protein [Gemmataceae bacterium]
MTHPASRPYVLMLAGSFSFTLMAELAHVLTRACDWQLVAVARAGLVAVFAGVIAYLAGAKLVFLRPWRLWVRSVTGSCSMVGTFYAFAKLPAADVLTLTNTVPIWIAVLSWPLYGKPPGWKMVAAILTGVAGVVLVEQPHLEAGNPGVFAALAAAVFTAVAMLGLHSLRTIDPRAIVVHFSAVATVVCLGAFLLIPRTHELAAGAGGYVPLQLVGMAATATVGQIFLTLAFGSGSPSKVSVVGLTQIVMALGFDAWLWDREVDGVTLLGTLLVIAPTAWLLTRSTSGTADHLDARGQGPGASPNTVPIDESPSPDASRLTPSLRP